MVEAGDLWLLIGNSRWHWAEAEPSPAGPVLRFRHSLPPTDPATGPAAGPTSVGWPRLRAWAAVGRLPEPGRAPAGSAGLPEQRRFGLDEVPLRRLPAWLGVDRALAGWQAWRRQAVLGGGGVLVADAGTVLSLTRVDGEGGFAGGRLQPGARLQLASMGQSTALLPRIEAVEEGVPPEPWPFATAQAMRSGCLRGLAAAIAQGWLDFDGGSSDGLWLTGGDGPLLLPLLREMGLPIREEPDLCLQGLVSLSSDRDR